jgi:hypothetical protein
MIDAVLAGGERGFNYLAKIVAQDKNYFLENNFCVKSNISVRG